jgi:hypothetical protein
MFTNKKKCTLKACELPVHDILPIEYTEVAILLHSHVIRESMNLMGSYSIVVASSKLGGKGSIRSKRLLIIWDLTIKFQLKKHSGRHSEPGESIRVIIIGSLESLSSIEVQKVIEDSIIEMCWMADINTSLPEYVAARDAAELAWWDFSLSIHRELRSLPKLRLLYFYIV